MRPFETLASATCLLAEDTPALRELFQPGQEVETFTSADDCRLKLAGLLDEPERARQLAEAGFRLILAEHTYEQRARVLLA